MSLGSILVMVCVFEKVGGGIFIDGFILLFVEGRDKIILHQSLNIIKYYTKTLIADFISSCVKIKY